jgi:xanthine dehydrogenase accessory factor
MTTEGNDWSVPESDVMARLRGALADGTEAVLATIVGVEGSAYRRPGAKMLLTPDGGVGSITAGCLEDEVRRLAGEVLEAGRPRIETYDLMEDDEDVWGLGVGCNGVITVLLEPIDASLRPAVAAYDDGRPVGVATVLEGDLPTGARGYYWPGEGFEGDGSLPAWLVGALGDAPAELVENGASDTVEVVTEQGEATVFVEGLTPPPELVVLGTGHDVGPVTELAKANDFRVTVVGFRGASAEGSRFPRADRVESASPARVAEAHEFDERTYAVVMSHNFVDDRLALEALLETEVPYVGLMGPRKRFEEMLEAFEDEGRSFSEAELERIYTPAGLDLGGGTPYNIAHSIVAEALAVHHGREPKHLSDREGPIHERVELEPEP